MRTNYLLILFSMLSVTVSAQVQQQIEPTSKNSDTIRLRCSGTIAANDVLYVVDGIPVANDEIKQLNPADILSVAVLKESEQMIFSCRKLSSVIIITTKKSNRKSFTVVDAKTNTGVAAASIKATFTRTGKIVDFLTNDFGHLETDSLNTDEYSLTVSATGYEQLLITGKEVRKLKYRIQLRPKFIELKEIDIVAFKRSKCRTVNIKESVGKIESLNGVIRCLASGVIVSEEKNNNGKSGLLSQPNINVYPNPIAANGRLQVSFSNLKPGAYQIRLLNVSGQLLHSVQKQISCKNETAQIHLSHMMAAGLYVVQVTDEKNTLIQTGKLMIQ